MKPGSALPWSEFNQNGVIQIDSGNRPGSRPCVIGWPGFDSNDQPPKINNANAAYIVHACNAYPRLVEALIMLRLEVRDEWRKTHASLHPDGLAYKAAYSLINELGEADK